MASRHTNVNAATHAVLEHRFSENAGYAVALHVSYSQSHGWKFVAVVEFELKTAVVRSAGRCDDQCGEQAMRQHGFDALWIRLQLLCTTAFELGA